MSKDNRENMCRTTKKVIYTQRYKCKITHFSVPPTPIIPQVKKKNTPLAEPVWLSG